MSKVFLIDSNYKPLDPIHCAQARQFLRNGKAAIYRQFPFTLILKESCPEAQVKPLRLKIDPGALFTGIALVEDNSGEVVFAAILQHRGFAIRDTLTSRRQLRRSRRNRKTRYRQTRFLNRTRLIGWLPPSLHGYETREYLLEKWDRECAYCGVKDVPLEVQHIHPKSKGGSNSITNLTLSCHKCNTAKGTQVVVLTHIPHFVLIIFK
jgi:5-methylcytosine-specific restriction endonuclease McrA